MFQRMLVPLDGSTRAERAIPVAARIACLAWIGHPGTGREHSHRILALYDTTASIDTDGQYYGLDRG